MSIRTLCSISIRAPWIRALLLAFFIALPATSSAFHFPWDQGHDTTDWDDPNDPGPCDDGVCDCRNSGASPVFVPTGHFVWSETDVSIPGAPALELTRTYNSNDPRDGMFGRGWTTNCDAVLLEYVGSEFDASDPVRTSGYVLRASDGKRYTFRRSASGVITAPAGRYERIEPQSDGDLRVVARDGSSRTYTAAGRLVATADTGGRALSYVYAADGRLQQITNPAGRFLAFSYNSRGRVGSIAESGGRSWQYSYDASGNLVSVTNPVGGIRRFEYSPYSPPGDGHTYYQLTRIVDESSLVITAVTYAGARVASYTEGENRFAYSYDTANRVVTKADLMASQWVYSYSDDGRVTSERDPLGNIERYGYDADGNVLRYTDALQREWRWTYDAQGRVETSVNPLGEQTVLEYTGVVPNPTRSTSPSGRRTDARYDSEGRLIELLDPTRASTTFTYGSNGHLQEIRNPLGHSTQYVMDASGLPQSVRDPLGRRTALAYNVSGQVVSITDPNAGQRIVEYDGRGLPSASIDAARRRTEFVRDAAGRVTAVVDPAGRSTRFSYDAYGRLATRVLSDGRRYEFVYRPDNLLLRIVRPDGIAETHDYDAAKRLTAKSAGGSTISYSYNAAGETLSATNSAGAISFAYDSVGRLINETSQGRSVTRAYNVDGERTRLGVLSELISFARDQRGLLVGIDAPEGAYAFAYDAAMRRIGLQYPNGTSTSYAYDAADQLIGLESTGPFSDSHSYTYNPAGEVLSAASTQATWSFQYDAAGQLSVGQSAARTFRYQYDDAGNRVGEGRTYDAANRLTQDQTHTYRYDANGNLIEKQEVASLARIVYRWNTWNQLAAVERFSGATSEQPYEVLTFTYDALGRRLSRAVNGLTEYYVYDNLNRVATLDAQGMVIERVTHGPNADEPLGLHGAAGSRYLHANYLGSIIGVSGSSQLLGRYDYEPYGSTLAAPNVANAFRYTGREHDADDLYFYRARYMDPGIGRFISEDPIGLEGGLNLYTYAANNPVGNVDPLGLSPSAAECAAQCASEVLGLDDLIDVGLIAAGQPIPGTKRFVTPGSSRGTSVAGMAADRVFGGARSPVRLPTIVGGPGTGRRLGIAFTTRIARFAGRAVPVIGWGLLAVDAVQFGLCMKDCLDDDCES